MLALNFIGCGRVGKPIAKLLSNVNGVEIRGILTRSWASTQKAIEFIGEGHHCKSINDLPPADIYFISTPDDCIETVAKNLVVNGILRKGAIVIHLSGALTSDVLKTTSSLSYYSASIHPIKSFANPMDAITSFKGTYCAIEGDTEALFVIQPLFTAIGANIISIAKNTKVNYHIAGVLAHNYLLTLHYHAITSFLNAGLDTETAQKIVSMLMANGITSLQTLTHSEALTGPIQRGDSATILQHKKILKANPTLDSVYSSLARATLSLTQHSDEKKKELEKLFHKF